MPTSWTERAKSLMHTRGLSQEDLASALSCTRGAVGHYLTGRRTPSLDQLVKLARVLNADPVWLLFGEEAGVRDQNAVYGREKQSVSVLGDVNKGLRRRPVGRVSLPVAHGGCYAVLINVNDYEPRIHSGETVVIDPSEAPFAGDEVLVRYRDGRLALHSLLRADGDSVTVDNLTGEKQVRTLSKRDYKSVQKIIAIMTVRREA